MVFLLTACAHRDEAADRKSLYLADSYYNLGKYDESLSCAGMVRSNSPYFRDAQKLIKRTNKARKAYIAGGYDHTYVGIADRKYILSRPDWEISPELKRQVRETKQPMDVTHP